MTGGASTLFILAAFLSVASASSTLPWERSHRGDSGITLQGVKGTDISHQATNKLTGTVSPIRASKLWISQVHLHFFSRGSADKTASACNRMDVQPIRKMMANYIADGFKPQAICKANSFAKWIMGGAVPRKQTRTSLNNLLKYKMKHHKTKSTFMSVKRKFANPPPEGKVHQVGYTDGKH